MSPRCWRPPGHRVVVPYLRGYGSTRFLSNNTVPKRPAVGARFDIIALMDALEIEKAILAGYDWGADRQHRLAALWPKRVQGPGLGERLSDRQPGSQQDAAAAKAELQWWYQYYFATERGRARLRGISARVREAHLADRLAKMGLR